MLFIICLSVTTVCFAFCTRKFAVTLSLLGRFQLNKIHSFSEFATPLLPKLICQLITSKLIVIECKRNL